MILSRRIAAGTVLWSLTCLNAAPAQGATDAPGLSSSASPPSPSTTPTALETLAPATLVTLSVQQARPEDVLAELARQCGYEMRPQNEFQWQRANLPDVTLALDHQPFWTALREVCRSAHIGLVVSGDKRFLFVPQAAGQTGLLDQPHCTVGAFDLILDGVRYPKILDPVASPKTPQPRLYLHLIAEPKVVLWRYSFAPEMAVAVDEQGNSLLPAKSDLFMMSGVPFSLSVVQKLTLPDKRGTKIAKFTGLLRCQVQTAAEQVEFEDILNIKDLSKELRGVRLTVKQVQEQGDGTYQARLVIDRAGMDAEQYGDLVNNLLLIRLLDAEGQAFWPPFHQSLQRQERIEFQLKFSREQKEPAGAPAKLIWEIPTELKEVQIPFEFTDIPLP
jgi:hypothetical protein